MKTPSWILPLAQKHGAGDPIAYLASHSRSFRFATRFLSGEQAREIAEVYAFCRFTDDLVDAAPELPEQVLEGRLLEWETLARRAYGGEATGLALLDVPLGRMGRKGISFAYVSLLIEGMRMDIRTRTYADLQDLETYTYRVAGVVGQWLTDLAGVRNPWALSRASDLGHAMQLTNILRDVGEDWDRGRLYLPLDALARHGFSPGDIGDLRKRAGRPPAAYRNLVEELLGVAERKYSMAFQGIPSLPEYFQRPVLVSALVYRDIHGALRGNGYDNFNLRAHSSPGSKFWVGLRALWILPSLRDLYPPGYPPVSVPASRGEEVAYGH